MTADSIEVADALFVQRWRRFGHDRAYVKQGDRDLGYRDLKTGEVHGADRAEVDVVRSATDQLYAHVQETAAPDYQPRHGSDSDSAAAVPSQAPQPAAPAPLLLPDRDLALNVPGQAAREQARELRDAAPLRTFIARAIGAKTDERNWRIGADGEEDVGRRLQRLEPEWRVLHAVPVGDHGSDIDHVVIGLGGVFTVNVKHHPQANVWIRGDTVKVNGSNQPYVRNSRHEAGRAAKLLTAAVGFDVPVRGVIAVMGAHRGFVVKQQPTDGLVSVLARKDLVGCLRAAPAVLDATQVEAIYDAARHLSTWQPTKVRRQELAAPAD